MEKYTFKFHGRQAGAIGITYDISETYQAESMDEAKSLLYQDYDQIRRVSVFKGSKKIDIEIYNKAAFVPVRSNKTRERGAKGSYKYTRSDSPTV